MRGADDVDPGVGVVDPVDGHLVDAQAVVLGEHEQLGVEEPALVLDGGRRARATSVRTALKPHWASEKPLRSVALRSRLYAREIASRFGPAHDARAGGQPGADGDVAVARHERRDERQQRVEVGREVDVHVGDDARRAADHAARSARPRPFWSRCSALTPSSSAARRQAMPHVRSVLALSAIVTATGAGSASVR